MYLFKHCHFKTDNIIIFIIIRNILLFIIVISVVSDNYKNIYTPYRP